MTTIIASIIAGLVLLSIGLSVKIAQLLHSLKLSNRENETLRKENFESDKRQEQDMITINKKHFKSISKLKKEISDLTDKHEKEILKLQPSKLATSPKSLKTISKHIEEVLNPDDKNS